MREDLISADKSVRVNGFLIWYDKSALEEWRKSMTVCIAQTP